MNIVENKKKNKDKNKDKVIKIKVKKEKDQGFYFQEQNLRIIRGTNSLDLVQPNNEDFETSILNNQGFFVHIWHYLIKIYDNIGYQQDIEETEYNYNYSKLLINYIDNKGVNQTLSMTGEFDFSDLLIGNKSIEEQFIKLHNLEVKSLEIFVHKNKKLLNDFELKINAEKEKELLTNSMGDVNYHNKKKEVFKI